MRKGGLYLAIGDSTTYNTVTNGANLYPSVIQSNIASNYGKVHLVNKGLATATSGDVLKDLKALGKDFDPDIVSIGLGMNDAHYAVATSTYQSNLQAIINHYRVQNPDVKIFVCTPNTVGTSATFTTESALTGFRTAVDNVVADYASGVYAVHFENAWSQSSGNTYVDASQYIHPNDQGHPLVANLLWTSIQTNAMSWLQTLGH